MKNFLAVDTSCGYMSVVAGKNGNVVCSFLPDCTMRHSVKLMQTVDETLEKAGLTPAACDFFASVVGAGSFTGIRIGISAMKGFALACGKPTLAITSFDVAAYNAVDGWQGDKLLCLVDALHDTYYACGYEKGKVVLQPCYLTEAEVLALAKEGYELRACEELPISQKIPVQTVSPVEGLKNAVLAKTQNGKTDSFGELDALYIRKSSAELNAQAGQSK